MTTTTEAPPAVEKTVNDKPPATEEPAPKKQKVADAPAEATPAAEPAAAPETEAEAEPAVAAEKSEVAGWPDHKMNINLALMKESEGKRYSEIMYADVSILQGIGEKSKEVMEELKVKTVKDLSEYKFYKMAKAIVALASAEEKDARAPASVMNMDQAVDAEFETKPLADIVNASVSSLQGLSEGAAKLLGDLHVKTVSDLAAFKHCMWAEAIVTLAEFEHKKSAAERKQEKMLKRLE